MALIAELEQQAQYSHDKGDMTKTLKLCRHILAEKPDHVRSLEVLSTEALANDDFAEAEQYLAVLARLYPEDAVIEIKLGYAQEKQGNLDAALATYLDCYARYPENSIIYLYLGYLYVLKGDDTKAAEIFSLGESIDAKILKAHLNLKYGEIMRLRSKVAEQTLHKALTDLHLNTINDLDDGKDVKRIHDAVWPQIDVRDFDYRNESQKPHLFYIPDLPSAPCFNRNELDWVAGIEENFDVLKQEVLENLDMDGDGKPYIPSETPLSGAGWERLIGKMAWGSVHLYKQGVPDEAIIAKFPAVMKVLENIPLAIINGKPSEVFISVLKPETRIPPHFGVANNVLTVHFPLVVPDGCSLRVGKHTFAQKEGEIIAFDDSYDHEAMNPSREIRIVLIFEIWHPNLTEKEQKAISATFEARKKWLDGRKVI